LLVKIKNSSILKLVKIYEGIIVQESKKHGMVTVIRWCVAYQEWRNDGDPHGKWM
jgi:hypothetical protein